MDDTSMIWFALRGRRSSLLSRPKLSSSAARRQTFAAAMAQFEEQMSAAKVVSPATRPLNLYYGLAQAGMAIAAVHGPDQWSFSRHGLKLGDTNSELADIQVLAEGDGAFQRVAAATSSVAIDSPVSLSALWDSLPELRGVPLNDGPRRVALDLAAEDAVTSAPTASLFIPADQLEAGPDLPQRVYRILAGYPGAVGAAIPSEPRSMVPPPTDQGQWSITLRWSPPQMSREMTKDEIREFFDRIAPEHRYREDRYLRPEVGPGKVAPSPLMTWWLLLYSFSMLARYQPRKWTALLDLDRPGYAVSLQYALETALATIPHLVLEALDGRSFLMTQALRI